MAKKLYDSFKRCVITTVNDEFTNIFTNDWSYSDIESWMFDVHEIDSNSVISLELSSVKIYKYGKN